MAQTGQLRRVNNDGVLEERLGNLDLAVRDALGRIESIVLGMDTRLRSVETKTIADFAVLQAKVSQLVLKVEEQDRLITKMRPGYTAVMWLAGVFGVLIMTFLWAIFTHEIELK